MLTQRRRKHGSMDTHRRELPVPGSWYSGVSAALLQNTSAIENRSKNTLPASAGSLLVAGLSHLVAEHDILCRVMEKGSSWHANQAK